MTTTLAFYSDMSLPSLGGTMQYPEDRGASEVNGLVSLTKQILATDPVGTTTLTLENVVAGSNIYIDTQDGTTARFSQQYGTVTVEYDESGQDYDSTTLYDSQANVPIVLDLYQPGSHLNDLRVKVRKGTSAPYYIPYETQYTATALPTSIYVSQIPDE